MRHDMSTRYREALAARGLPVRFVDARGIDPGAMRLRYPVTIVPTAILMRDGREVARVTGYTAYEAVLQLIALDAPGIGPARMPPLPAER